MAAASNSPSTQYFKWQEAAGGVSFAVNFPTAPKMELILIGAELHQDMEQHDRLVLHFKGKPFVKGTELKHNDPVKFIFESEKVKKTWTGFIHHIEPKHSNIAQNTDVVCVGASAKLKEGDQEIYTNVTADEVVAKIAQKYGMTAVTQRHPRKRKAIVQAGLTDWQLCRRLAKQCGFALRVDNTTITFVSKGKIYNTNKKTAPYFMYVDTFDTGLVPIPVRALGTILNFTGYIADGSPETGANVDRVSIGVHETTGKIIKVTHPHKDIDFEPNGAAVPGEEFFL